MKAFISILSVALLFFVTKINAQKITYIRANYKNAMAKKNVCQLMIKNLSSDKIDNLELAYLGALETVWAKYVSNPFTKLSTFKKGKQKIETAVKKDPTNLEIRFLRLSIQKNAPGFLGYNDAVKTDELFLKKNLNKISSTYLRKMIENVLK